MYATNRPGSFIEGMGVEESSNNAESLHARWILAALAANIDVEGGEEQSEGYPNIISTQELNLYDMLSPEQRKKQIGADRFKLMAYPGQDLVAASTKKAWDRPGGLSAAGFSVAHQPLVCQAVLSGKPYPVRALFSDTHNVLVDEPNTKLVYKAIKSLDLHVVLEQWMTPTAELADYVLPAACWLERPILWDGLGYGQFVMSGEAALPPSLPGEYDRRSDYDIWRGLGSRLGQEEYWPWENLEQYYDYRLKPTGHSHHYFVHNVRSDRRPSEFKKYERRGFGTPTGKVELYSTILEKLGYDPLPRYREPAESPISKPELAKEYPLTLMTGRRNREYYHSEWRQIDSVRKLHPNPLLEIHPDTARDLGISEGDWVWIESPRGRIRHKAKFFDGMAPDIVHAEHCWWLPELPGEEPWLHGLWEVNVNVLTDDDPDICNPILGSWPLRTLLVKVYKAEEYK
jgi:thiosulfate reductase/polysulfide reductase chain A